MRTTFTRLLVTAAAALALAACSGQDGATTEPDPGTSASTSASTSAGESPSDIAHTEPKRDGLVIDITIQDDSVTPNGDRVEVPLGEPITLDITADRDGELHVHSTPEQEIEFQRGDTEVELTFGKPGIVEIEDHTSGKVIVQLEVR